MKQLLIIFLFGFLSFKVLSQPSVDIGLFGGAGTFFGDMTKVDFGKSVNPAYGGFIRFNFNPRYAVRFNILNGKIGGDGEFDFKPWNFNKNVLDLSLNFEWNYLKYIVGEKETPYSTFLFGGVGMQMYNYENRESEITTWVDPSYFDNKHKSGPVTSPIIPFGIGFKYNISKRWGIALEGGLRKSFSDKLDDLDDLLGYINLKQDDPEVKYPVKFTDQWHNNDWTSYIDVHLVYKLIYGNKNWELRTPKSRMIDWGIFNNNRKD